MASPIQTFVGTAVVCKLTVGLMLVVHAAIVAGIGRGDCPNKTELGHIGAAVYFWHTLRFDVFCVNPPLTRIVCGLPVVACRPEHDWDAYSSRPQDRCEWALGTAFIAANSPQKTRWSFTLARWSLIPFLLLGGYLGYRMSREVFGDVAGMVFLTLWCFSPLLLAWGATICPDAATAALGIVAVYALRNWLMEPKARNVAWAGITLGLLPLTKLTWIVAFGLWPVLWFLWALPLRRRQEAEAAAPQPTFRQLIAVMLLALYVLNLGYLFDGTFRPLGKYEFISRSFVGPQDSLDSDRQKVKNRFAGTWLGAIPLPLPADFVQGFDTQRLDFERGLPSYLRGKWAEHGWWYYYLYVMLVKMPLGTWGITLLAVFVAGRTVIGRVLRHKRGAEHLADQRFTLVPGDEYAGDPPSPPAPLPEGEGSRVPSPPAPLPMAKWNVVQSVHFPNPDGRYVASWRDEMLVLLPCVVLLLLVSSQTGFSKHPRYILPALPFFFVAISRVGVAFTPESRVMAVLASILLAYSVISSLSIYPHSLSYFNELAAVLPTPTDASYPQPRDEGFQHRGFWTSLNEALTVGPHHGPRHLLDSNIDWGQDLFYLEDWCLAHPEARPMKVAYFGGYPLEKTKIESAGLPTPGLERAHTDGESGGTACGPLPGWYALSVSEIYGQSQQYRYFLHFRPIALAGYSMYIYHIRVEDANRARQELGLPQLTAER